MEVQTTSREELVEITGGINRILRDLSPGEGRLLVFVPHTTAGLLLNENADPDVGADILNSLRRLVPARGEYRHGEGNSDAHIKSTLVGNSRHLPVEQGKLLLGTWQGLFLAEFDGPRRRTVYLQLPG